MGISRSYATNAIKVDHFTFQMLGVVQRMGPADVSGLLYPVVAVYSAVLNIISDDVQISQG